MPEVVTKELKVRAYVDAQTGQLKIFEADMDKVGKAVDKASAAMTRQEQKIQRQTNGLLKLGLATTGLNQQLGGLPNVLVEVANKFDNAGNAGVKFGSGLSSVVSKLGGLGTAALAAGAAMAGWKIGRWISDVTGLDNAIRRATDAMLGFGSAADSADAAYTKAMNRLAQAGITNKKLNEDITKANIAAQNQIQEAFTTTAERLARVQGEMYAIMTRDQSQFTADENRAMAKRYTELTNLSATYQVEIKTEQIRTNQEMAKEAARAAEAERKLQQKLAEDIIKFRQEAAKRSFDYQKDQAEKSTALLRQQIADEIRANNERKQAAENLNNAVLDAALERIEREKAALAELAAYEKQNQLDRLSQWASFFGQIGQMIGGIGGGAFGAIGAGIDAYGSVLEKIFNNEKDLFGNSLTGANAWAAGIAGAFSSLASQIGGTAGKILGAIGAIARGFAAGGPWGAVIAGIGVAINLFAELFKKDWGKETRKQVDILIDGLEISDDLLKQIEQDAKEMGNAMRAALINLPAIFDELGASLENFFALAQSAQDVLSGVEQGILSTAEASEILNQILPQLFEVAIEGGEEYMDRMTEILQMTQQFGIDISDVTDLIREKIKEMQAQLLETATSIAENMLPIIEDLAARIEEFWASIPEGMGRNDEVFDMLKQDALAYGEILLQTVNAMKLAGASTADILAAAGPALDALREGLAKLGLTLGDVGLGWLRQAQIMREQFPTQISLIELITKNLQDMRTAGIDPGAEGFRSMQDAALKAFDQINKDGKVSKAELELMRPLLIQLAADSLAFGYALSPATIELLKQAGLWDDIAGKPDATKVQQQGIGDLITALTKEPDGLIPTLQRFIEMLAELNGMVITPMIAPEYVPPDTREWGGGNWRAFQGLRGVYDVPEREVVIVDKGEKIVGKDTRIGGSKTININIYGGDPMRLRDEIRQLERDGEI